MNSVSFWREHSTVHPLSMAGTLATLEALSENHGERLRYCHKMADTLRESFQGCHLSSLPLVVRPFPGSFPRGIYSRSQSGDHRCPFTPSFPFHADTSVEPSFSSREHGLPLQGTGSDLCSFTARYRRNTSCY